MQYLKDFITDLNEVLKEILASTFEGGVSGYGWYTVSEEQIDHLRKTVKGLNKETEEKNSNV